MWKNQIFRLFLLFAFLIALTYCKDAFSKVVDLYLWDINLWKAIMKVESNCNHPKYQIGDKGKSIGAYQVSIDTARRLGFMGKKSDLLDYEINFYYARELLTKLYFESKGDIYRALFLYNSKRSALKNFYKSGKKSFRESNYVRKLIRTIQQGKQCEKI